VVLPISPLTEKDREDLRFALAMGVDWVALSFVQRPEDIEEARALIGDQAMVLSKLEKAGRDRPARCDRAALGCDHGGARRPGSRAAARARSHFCSGPSCAPAGARGQARDRGHPDARVDDDQSRAYPRRGLGRGEQRSSRAWTRWMLSAESASGKYPVESVAMMDRIIREVEGDAHYRMLLDANQEVGTRQSGRRRVRGAAPDRAHRIGQRQRSRTPRPDFRRCAPHASAPKPRSCR